ncbi:MAG: Peptidoglycan N-acetylglucosamine deacetylase [Labilithrix sp.]|nr:Peptidoglycan N-acetylglucosamine deacetylase [Labilithrix sp.]
MVRGPASAGRRIALTFDDGPDDRTLNYLDLLDELGVRATFFLVGNASARKPELVREYIRRGHQIGGHGYNHDSFTHLRPAALVEQVERTNAVLGPQPTKRPWVRPPYGHVDALVLARLIAHGNMIALWSFDSHDYRVKDADALVARCAPENISPGDVLLLHEGQQWTLDALPRIVAQLRGAGYQLVTMAELAGE